MNINKTLRLHSEWLAGASKGKRADLSKTDLTRANLTRADLRWANLRWANLRDANLRKVDLRGANLNWTQLRKVDLTGANLSGADLLWADLRGANLSGVDLTGADLSGAKLRGANLSGADLTGAIGLFLLPIQDPRGYAFPHAVLVAKTWRIRAGCRDFTIAGARDHWGNSYIGHRCIGDMYLRACDWLEKRIAEQEAGDE